MFDDLTDKIYEAAFVPDMWAAALEAASELSGSASGSIFVMNDNSPTRGRISDNSMGHGNALESVRPVFEEFLTGENWKLSPGVMRMYDMHPASFVHVEAFMSEEEIERDLVRLRLRAAGIGAHLCSAVAMPSGELVTFVFQRWTKDGFYDQPSVDRLDQLRPHLARAGLISARLGVEQARATVSALETIGLPAAVLTASGRVVTANVLLESMPSLFIAIARGGLALGNASANALFQEAVIQNQHSRVVRSIPIPAKEDQPALVIHLLPLRRAAHEIFSGGDILIAATAVGASSVVPSPTLLAGLFDLTPAEARLAAALSRGQPLKDAAFDLSITVKTGRTYLERIFAKTGTRQQSQLVALLRNAELPSRG
ncbi:MULTISPECIES: helix-turn-helix transcriptional regulator [unclassified Mesorhizobium]|uniref:helix-turn-helix transcriptional regulator n=1 Tax=unclassified Mesorhizobium TaxID=325217 RepID=UPI00112D7FEA|nr:MULTISPECIES: helix-turn-helix transcriptional regulator [unclassified Mesorhizobium]MBZ9973862.1 helix-turn-helix transcriptional regulator [Mesorhizobium sp. BR-1-1-10]TPK10146.1 helix-turn-helix transcriptional regulator [Mesorhizobium sp. B2-5-7]